MGRKNKNSQKQKRYPHRDKYANNKHSNKPSQVNHRIKVKFKPKSNTAYIGEQEIYELLGTQSRFWKMSEHGVSIRNQQ
jgi:hypothetical protein